MQTVLCLIITGLLIGGEYVLGEDFIPVLLATVFYLFCILAPIFMIFAYT